MSDSEDGAGPLRAATKLGSNVGAEIMAFWVELKRWVGSLRTANKIILIALGYFISDFLMAVGRRLLTAAFNSLLTAIGQADFTLTGFDFLFLIVYLETIILVALFQMMRRINKLSGKLEDMETDQKRLDGGRVQKSRSSEPWLSRFLQSRVFLLANVGFVLGFFISIEQAMTLAATGALAGFLFPSNE